MVELDPQRFFSSQQRQVLYSLAEGCCELCGKELVSGWNADHRIPWIAGGPTTVENGQALCAGCNNKKGREMQFQDRFKPRPFQADVVTQVIDGIESGRDRTVVLASPGSGKTLAYLSLATRLFREGRIDHIAVFVPRVTLAQQCEIGWQHLTPDKRSEGLCKLFETPRFGKIWHRTNEVPLTEGKGTGFVATYSALATSESIFLEWATKHQGRFLLIADEAQFCGDSKDNDGGGTRAGTLIQKLHGFALHTLLLTGTPYRADNAPLVLADYAEPRPDDPRGLRPLVKHAEATYADGIAENYLRTFEMHLTEARVSRRTLGDPADRNSGDTLLTYNLSDDGDGLAEVLRDPKTWEPLVEQVVDKVRDKQRFNPEYRGLISCMGQSEARKVQKYLQSRHPGLRVGIAVSSDTEAPRALAEFRSLPMDILVTVRMAFIGYDCPQISVVGILTHYRDTGHLMQLVGRGLRVWSGMAPREQSCLIIAPDDPKMKDFLEHLRGQREEGLRRVKEREAAEESTGTAEEGQLALTFVESAVATTTRAASNDTDVESDELMLIESIKVEVDSAEDATKLARFLDLYGIRAKRAQDVPGPRGDSDHEVFVEMPQPPRTDKEIMEDLRSRTTTAITRYLHACGVAPGSAGYQDAVQKATFRVNEVAGYTTKTANTVDRAEKRLKAALALK
ncbi:DEAD/DEAH box helicase family protein [Streptomyces sp. NPDC056503]|uniref:DEAD/DEAH box helicase family protein n=1 Tax=Streptomyces sp. NPDC056503 TaxID=3345842 RepID=UPI0036791CB3